MLENLISALVARLFSVICLDPLPEMVRSTVVSNPTPVTPGPRNVVQLVVPATEPMGQNDLHARDVTVARFKLRFRKVFRS